jgi:hypothetical protein
MFFAAVHFSDGTRNSAIFALSLRWLIYYVKHMKQYLQKNNVNIGLSAFPLTTV